VVAFRALQAVGGSMLNPVAMSIIAATFTDPSDRARAVGAWGAVAGLSVASGPVLGGLLVSGLGWRRLDLPADRRRDRRGGVWFDRRWRLGRVRRIEPPAHQGGDPVNHDPAGPAQTTVGGPSGVPAQPAQPTLPALAAQAWAEMQAFVTGEDRARALRAELDLGPRRSGVLIRLAHGPMTLREIAETADVDPPTATVAVDQLQRRGLVRRGPHPDDNRRKLVHLTVAGRRAAEAARRILTDPPGAFAALDPGDLAALTRILAILNTTLEPAPARPGKQLTAQEGKPMALLGTLLRNHRPDERNYAWNHPRLTALDAIEVTSSDFTDEHPLDTRHAGKRVGGENLSPHLAWSKPPAAAAAGGHFASDMTACA
jgi:DNA-binding MarR family transcriptional regulator